MIEFHLNPRSELSYNAQLIRQVRQAVRFGRLRPGDQLPTVREVISRLAVNPNTILKAYSDLEHAGLVVTRIGVGTFVSADAPEPIDRALYDSLTRDLTRWLGTARRAGMDDQTTEDLFDHLLRLASASGAA
ncbi:MAG: GntR family transcriptional regulator [Candidatus Dormiibacterota bacterium]